MREVCVERDGGCLFRSLAVALFHQIYQINLGKGCLWGREKTVRQVAHNVVARWVRTLVVASLAGMATADPHVRLGNLNFFEMAENLFSFLQAYPKDKHVDPRVLRAEKRALAPQAPTGMFGGPGHSTVYAPENVRGDVVSLSAATRASPTWPTASACFARASGAGSPNSSWPPKSSAFGSSSGARTTACWPSTGRSPSSPFTCAWRKSTTMPTLRRARRFVTPRRARRFVTPRRARLHRDGSCEVSGTRGSGSH